MQNFLFLFSSYVPLGVHPPSMNVMHFDQLEINWYYFLMGVISVILKYIQVTMCIIWYLYLMWMEGVEFRYFLWNPSWLLQRNNCTKTMNIITIYFLEIKIRIEDWTRKIGRPEAYLYAGWLMPGSRWVTSWPENSGSERPLIAGFFFFCSSRRAQRTARGLDRFLFCSWRSA